MLRKFLTVAAATLAISVGVLGANAAPTQAATTCDAGSYRPTGSVSWVTGNGLITCSNPIYQIRTTVELQRVIPNGGGAVYTVSSETISCYNTSGCGRGAATSNALTGGGYRIKTSGYVRATSGANWYPVAARYSTQLNL